jgi:hypothetical protein
MPIVYDIRTDYLYQRGIEDAKEESQEEVKSEKINFIKRLLDSTNHTYEEIAVLSAIIDRIEKK